MHLQQTNKQKTELRKDKVNQARAMKTTEDTSRPKSISPRWYNQYQSQTKSKKYILTSQFSNNIASSVHRVSTLVQTADRIQQGRSPDNSTSARQRASGTQSSNWRVRCRQSIHGCRKQHKSDLCKNSSGDAHIPGVPQAYRLFLPWNSTNERKLSIRSHSTRRLLP
jgi:hypothetical protein